MLHYQLNAIERLSSSVSRVVLQNTSPIPLVYTAGQYIKLLPLPNQITPFSIACAPQPDACLEFHVAHAAKNHSAQKLMQLLTTRGFCLLRGPYGKCTVANIELNRPLIFFARGTGFAPVKAILEELALLEQTPKIHLFWGAAHAEDFYLPDLLRAWREHFTDFTYTLAISRSADQQQLHHHVLAHYPNLASYQVYASGADKMITNALTLFQQHGLSQQFFYADMFDYRHDA